VSTELAFRKRASRTLYNRLTDLSDEYDLVKRKYDANRELENKCEQRLKDHTLMNWDKPLDFISSPPIRASLKVPSEDE